MTNTGVIAIVDDEEPVRTMLGRLLVLDDYRVAAFASGETFLESLGADAPACVILDVYMPGMSGLQVHAQLRAMGRSIPAVFITASDDQALDQEIARTHGAKVLRKPFTGAALLAAVRAAMDGMRGMESAL